MKKNDSIYEKPNGFIYNFTRVASFLWNHTFFHTHVLRNELKHGNNNKRGYIILSNHLTQWDFLPLIYSIKDRLSIVMSESFYKTSKIQPILRAFKVIPKLQWQTSISDIKRMKNVIKTNHALLLYPAGINSDDGTDTKFPLSTSKFLKWLNCDIFIAKNELNYFNRPKWDFKFRFGSHNYVDIYSLLTKEELANTSLDDLDKLLHEHLDFDVYDQQEIRMKKVKNLSNIEGIENIVYQCPKCLNKYTLHVHDKNTIKCDKCGFMETSDDYGFLNSYDEKINFKHLSKWSKWIQLNQKKEMLSDPLYNIKIKCDIETIDDKKKEFVKVGEGTVTFIQDRIELKGIINGSNFDNFMPISNVPMLTNFPNKFFEIQIDRVVYRCIPENKKLVQECMNYCKNQFRIKNNIE